MCSSSRIRMDQSLDSLAPEKGCNMTTSCNCSRLELSCRWFGLFWLQLFSFNLDKWVSTYHFEAAGHLRKRLKQCRLHDKDHCKIASCLRRQKPGPHSWEQHHQGLSDTPKVRIQSATLVLWPMGLRNWQSLIVAHQSAFHVCEKKCSFLPLIWDLAVSLPAAACVANLEWVRLDPNMPRLKTYPQSTSGPCIVERLMWRSPSYIPQLV